VEGNTGQVKLEKSVKISKVLRATEAFVQARALIARLRQSKDKVQLHNADALEHLMNDIISSFRSKLAVDRDSKESD